MEFILNEQSLNGQYADVSGFIEHGIKPLFDVVRKMESLQFYTILKNSNFWQRPVVPGQSFYDILFSRESRMNDFLRKTKSILSRLQNEPYWDVSPVQDATKKYLLRVESSSRDVTNTGVAEAYARKACLISFALKEYDYTPLEIQHVGQSEGIVHNIRNSEHLIKILFDTKVLDVSQYVKNKFCSKLNFDYIDSRNGLNLINKEKMNSFLNSFQDFERMTWQQIITSDAFDYKDFHKNRSTRDYFSPEDWDKGVKKFRISQEIRCFGYVLENVFYVRRIDLDHILSDKG